MKVFFTAVDVREGQSGVIVFTLRDESGDLVPKAALDSLTVDLYRWFNGAAEVINGRDQQSVLDANGGAYFDALQTMPDEDGNNIPFNFRWRYEPDDTPFLGEDTDKLQTELHVAHFRMVWAGETKSMGHEVRMTVTNFRRFTAPATT